MNQKSTKTGGKNYGTVAIGIPPTCDVHVCEPGSYQLTNIPGGRSDAFPTIPTSDPYKPFPEPVFSDGGK